MNSKELKSKINDLEYDVSELKLKKAGFIRLIIFICLAILGGGLALGFLFGSVAKIMMLAVAASVLTSVTAIKEVDKASIELKYVRAQIKDYQSQIDKLEGKSNTVKQVKVEKKEEKKDYSYKREETPKKKSPDKIETFDMNDFDEFDVKKR